MTFQTYRLAYGVFDGEQSRTKIFIKNRKSGTSLDPEARGQTEQDENVTAEHEKSANEDFLSKKSEFLRSFYFNHFLNNFENLHNTMKRLGNH